MPEFEVALRQEAMARSDTGKRSQVIREYVEYVESLGPDQAGRITFVTRRDSGHRTVSSWGCDKGDA